MRSSDSTTRYLDFVFLNVCVRSIRRIAFFSLEIVLLKSNEHRSDVVKIRLQTQETSTELMYKNFFQASRRIVKEEGLVGWRGGLLFPGIVPSIMREFGYSSFRFGMYPIVKQKLGISKNKDVGLGRKICAGLITGGLGSALATPTDLVKIRQQKEAGLLKDGKFVTGLRIGHRPMYVVFCCSSA